MAETADTIYLIETKKEGDMDTAEVQEKSQSAIAYCRHATEFTVQNGGKPWKYILIPHDVVKMNMGFDTLVKNFDVLVKSRISDGFVKSSQARRANPEE